MNERKPLAEHWTAGIFKKFQARYGHKWTSAIDGIESVAISEWSHELRGLTPDEIERGLDRWDSNWPPSSKEFRKACTGQGVKNDFGLDFVPEYYRSKILDKKKLLSSDERDKRREKVSKHITALKRKLRGGGNG